MNWMMTDMDSYFASVERSLRPELRDRPIGVIPVETESTCVIAASYDAKRLGVKVGTKVREARRLCPRIRFVKARPKIYVDVHHQILRSVDKHAPIHHVYSIDEWSISLRGTDRHPRQARQLAENIKRQLFEDFGPWLTCSIGIAPTRLLAKIASDLEKPNGIAMLSVDDLPHRLEHLPLRDLCGINHGMLARFEKHGVRNVRDLWGITRDEAVQIWGSVSGTRWWAGFHGLDEPEIPTRRRSMSHGNVLEPRFRNVDGAYGILIRLICKLAQRLRRDGYFARVLRISIGDESGNLFGEEIALPCVNDTPTLLQQFTKLWQQRPPTFHRIKKVDVSVAKLVMTSQVSRSLFEPVEKLRKISETVDKINQRWGTSSVYFGAVHLYRHPMDNKIAFGRIPDETE